MSENIQEKEPVRMPSCDNLIVSSSPHIHNRNSIHKIMYKVIIALAPIIIASIFYFGMQAVRVILLTAVFCVAAEALWCAVIKKPILSTVFDGSALVTGVILGLNFNASTPWYVCLIGAFLAIWLAKQLFGGLGYNPFNPAVVARVGLLIALPGIMTLWTPNSVMKETARHSIKSREAYTRNIFSEQDWEKMQRSSVDDPSLDGITCATPLSIAGAVPKSTGIGASSVFADIDNRIAWREYFLGNKSGTLGEICILAIVLGGFLLIIWRLINWRVPVFFVGTVFVITGMINYFYPAYTPSAIFHILTGGLMFSAFFMATDMVTSPVTNRGCVIFGIGCGLVTSVIRIWGNYPEGVSFAILLMNALVPFIDKLCIRRPFGYDAVKEENNAVK